MDPEQPQPPAEYEPTWVTGDTCPHGKMIILGHMEGGVFSGLHADFSVCRVDVPS